MIGSYCFFFGEFKAVTLNYELLVPSLGDLFQQPVATGCFAPGLPPSEPPKKSPSVASLKTPTAEERRAQYQNRSSPTGPTPSPMEHDGVGDGNNPEAGNRFACLTPVSLQFSPSPPLESQPVPKAPAPATPPSFPEPNPPAIAPADAEPANTGTGGVYDNGMYWKSLDRDSLHVLRMYCTCFMQKSGLCRLLNLRLRRYFKPSNGKSAASKEAAAMFHDKEKRSLVAIF